MVRIGRIDPVKVAEDADFGIGIPARNDRILGRGRASRQQCQAQKQRFQPDTHSRPSPVFPLQTTEACSSSPRKRRGGPFGAPPGGELEHGAPPNLYPTPTKERGPTKSLPTKRAAVALPTYWAPSQTGEAPS